MAVENVSVWVPYLGAGVGSAGSDLDAWWRATISLTDTVPPVGTAPKEAGGNTTGPAAVEGRVEAGTVAGEGDVVAG